MKNLIIANNERDRVDEANNIIAFFKNYPPDVLTEKLWELYKSRLLYTSAYGTAAVITKDLIFYEDLTTLLEEIRVNEPRFCHSLQTTIEPSFTEHTLVSLEGVINFIKQAIPVGVIYNLSSSKEEIDLIVVLEKSCNKAYSEFENIVELTMLGYQKGTCTVHNYGLLNGLMNKGHIFYSTACMEKNIVYQKSTDDVFPALNPQLFETVRVTSESLFKNGMDKAVNFYDGAQYYISVGVNTVAIFMLQQACELTYRCLLNVLRGKDVKCHSPSVLRKHIRRFAPEIIGIFSNNEEEELCYLQVLEDAYVKSRYNANYTVDDELIKFLNERVGLLQQKAHQLFEHKIAILKEQIMLGQTRKDFMARF